MTGASADPTLVVLAYSALSAGCALFGVLPLIGRRDLPTAWIGWANAVAAGMMLGAAYSLAEVSSTHPALAAWPLRTALGAVLGIFFIYSTHAALRTAELGLNERREQDATYGYKVVLVNALHSASEGIAIGVAMALDLRLGIFLALAIAVHNIPEATVLAWVLGGQKVRLADAAALAVAANATQVVMAVSVFAVVSAAPAALPWALGFAAGALINLVLVELLPESYREAGHTPIAVVASVAMGIVVLVKGLAL